MSEKTQGRQERKSIVGNYELGRTLGEGTFGKVKAAVHIPTNEPVAIKILQKSRIIDVADVERVSRQIHILKLVRHANLIQLYEIVETSTHLFLVMQYVTNGELFDHIVKNKKLKEKDACRIYQQIIAGIEYLHKINVTHRDLKPENVLIDFDGTIKLVDFGLSNTYKPGQKLNTACGSPCYASPQMVKGLSYDGLSTDIWSSGIVLFAMVCGYLPFEDPNTSKLYDKIKAGKYRLPKEVSEPLKDILSGILNVDPEKRLTVSEIKKHNWCSINERKQNPLTGVMIGYDRMPIDFEILNQLKGFGFELENAQKSLEANRHNAVTTTYYLLLKKNRKNGISSKADIACRLFDTKLLLPLKKQRSKTVYQGPEDFLDETARRMTIENFGSNDSLKKGKTPSDRRLGRSSTKQTYDSKSLEKVEVGIKLSRKYKLANIKTSLDKQRTKTCTGSSEPDYSNLIQKYYMKAYRRPLVSKSREKSTVKQNASSLKRYEQYNYGSIHLSKNFLAQSNCINGRMSKMRPSVRKQQPQRGSANMYTSKSSQKAASFLY